ncbi:MAG: hypothetical protein V4479_07555 [Actinomycetota bacterium]
MADLEVKLLVNGRAYSGWKAVRITRSIEALAGSFTLDVSDRWGDDSELWPIVQEDPCKVTIGPPGQPGQTVIAGYIDERDHEGDASSIALGYSGKDRAGALVENSLLIETPGGTAGKSHKTTWRNIDIAQFVTQIAEQFAISVSVQPGLELVKDPLLVAHSGETCYEAIKRAAGSSGVLVVSDGNGGIVITRRGSARAAALILGFNIMRYSIKYDGKDRFRRYKISSQIPGSDEVSGAATSVLAEAVDIGVQRLDRVQVIRPDKAMDVATAKRRADWEARTRAARAETLMVTVQGWTQPNSTDLWPLNALALVVISRAGINGDMLISQVEYTTGEGGTITQLHLVRPDAFEPEPQTATTGGTGAWNELAKGV